MKKNEIIELNGQEYTLELNRESFIQIDRLCNIQKSMNIIREDLYPHFDDVEITDDFDFDKLIVTDEEIEKKVQFKIDTLKKLAERAFMVWLKSNHDLKPSEVVELLKPYWEDDEKSMFISEKVGQYLQESISIRDEYNEERKNLKAQTNE